MRTFKLADMVKGWFVGNFSPTCFSTDKFEVGCKYYSVGDKEQKHVHVIATEITLIAKGIVKMNGRIFKSGDIVVLDPGESCDFEVLQDTMTVVLKIPSVKGDKYIE